MALVGVCLAHSPLDLLDMIKMEQDLSNDTYFYEIPDTYQEHPGLFHQYFNHYQKKIPTDSIEGDGYIITLPDDEKLYFDAKDIDDYGFVDFELPIGELPQIEADVFDHVNTPSYSALEELEHLADDGDLDAARIIADIHLMGLYEIKVDLKRSQELYTKLTQSDDLQLQGHGHFMLGFIHTTGLLGKVPQNPAKGLIHYKFASDLGNIQAQMTMAHKYMFGINVSKDVNQAIYYFSLAKEQSSLLKYSDYETVLLNNFNIRWSDLTNGVYEMLVSQQFNSVRRFESFEDYEEIKKATSSNSLGEETYDYISDEVLDAYSMLYFQVHKAYRGDYMHARDFKKSFEYAEKCVNFGKNEPEISRFFDQVSEELAVDHTEPEKQQSRFDFTFSLNIGSAYTPLSIFVGRCAQYLGHMYLTGEGGVQDDGMAYFYTKLGREMAGFNSFISDLGIMQYRGTGVKNNTDLALKTLGDTSRYLSSRYVTALINLDKADGELDDATLVLLKSSAHHSLLAARKLIELYESEDPTSLKNDVIVSYYNEFLKFGENDYFDFKLPFYAFINAKKNNTASNNMWTALVGMAITSEIGYEHSQSSLGSIMYPSTGEFGKRSFKESEYAQTKIYTPKRFDEAVFYYGLSAKHTNRDSINFLGDIYYNGLYRGKPMDDPLWNQEWWKYILPVSLDEGAKTNTLVKILRKVEQKVKQLFNFTRFDSTVIIPRDLGKAISYYQDASLTGSPMGSYNIGWAYEYGIGVSQDLHLAKRYYDLAFTEANDACIIAKIAVLRLKIKITLWSWLGFDGRGV